MTDDAQLARANRDLFERIKNHVRGRVMTSSLYSSLCDLVTDHRFECNMRGVAFPETVVVWLDGIRAVKVVRADIERRDLEVTVVNWTREHPDVTAAEIARALARHFPGYARQVSLESVA